MSQKNNNSEISIRPLLSGSGQLLCNCPEISVSETQNKTQRVSDSVGFSQYKVLLSILFSKYKECDNNKMHLKLDKQIDYCNHCYRHIEFKDFDIEVGLAKLVDELRLV